MSTLEKQSTAVVAAATIGLIMSIAIAAIAILGSLALILGPGVRGQPPRFPVLIAGLVMSLCLLAVAAFGIVASIGLLRNRNWSRIAAIVIAALMVFFSVVSQIAIILRFNGSSIGRATLLIVSLATLALGLWWLVLFTRKHVIQQFSDNRIVPESETGFTWSTNDTGVLPDSSPMASIETAAEPFALLRARGVFLRMLLALLATIGILIVIYIAGRIALGPAFNFRSPLLEPLIAVFLYGIAFLFIVRMMHRVKLGTNEILGRQMVWAHVRRYWVLPLFLVAISATSYSAVFVPLSFAAPRFIDWYIVHSNSPELFWFTGFGYPVANVLMMLSVVVVAPIVEEFIFRGVLLNRWAYKWGMPRAILVSSLIFGFLHKEFLGHIFFGYVMSVLYVETKSLFVPMFMHAANNAIAWAGGAADVIWGTKRQLTLPSFQSEWRVSLVLAAVFIPLAVWFIRRHFPKSSWTTPYAELRGRFRDGISGYRRGL